MISQCTTGRPVVWGIAFLMLIPLRSLSQQPQVTPPATPPTPAAHAQDSSSSLIRTQFTRTSIFPNPLSPYGNPKVPPQRLANSRRIYSLIQDGKLRLSLADAIALALEDNLDIDLSRYNMAYASTDVVRAASGQATRGVTGAFQSASVFSGAVGGGIGSAGSGGGGGGAGSATGGTGGAFNIGSLGTFDPFVGLTAGYDDSVVPLGTNTVTGIGSLTTHTGAYTGFFGEELPTGTSYVFFGGGSRQSTNALTNFYNPQLTANGTIAVSQNLLSGFGYRANAKFIRIAANDVKIANSVFRQQVITTISQIENAYWNLATAQENLRVAQEAVDYAQKLLNDNLQRKKIGTLASIDVIHSESQLANAQTNLVVAQTTYLQQQSALKTTLTRRFDKTIANASVVTTDPLPNPGANEVPDLDEALELARRNRPEVEQDALHVSSENVILKANRNGLLPSLQVFGSWNPSALGGQLSPFARASSALLGAGGLPGGAGNLFTQIFQNSYPDYSYGASLQMPIKNRQAQADAARAELEARALHTQAQQHLNNIGLDVRNSLIAMAQARAQVNSAEKALQYSQQLLAGEQVRFKLGESTVSDVIQRENDRITAEGNLVKAYSTYAQAISQYAQATGTTLERHNIQIEDAMNGVAPRSPGQPSNKNQEPGSSRHP